MLAQTLTRRLFHAPGSITTAQQLVHKHFNRNSSMASNGTVAEKPVEKAMIAKLTETFRPSHLQVINESHMHNVPSGSESHFKVVVISDKFDKMNLIGRHRLVHETLSEELCGSIHALSIQARTPLQWEGDNKITKSPPCLGGMAREAAEKKDST